MIFTPQIVEEYTSRIAPQFHTQKNFDLMRVLIDGIVAGGGVNIQEIFLNIDKSEGKWLDILGELVGAYRSDLYKEVVLRSDINSVLDGSELMLELDGVSSNINTIYSNNYSTDEWYKIYIKLKIIQNYSKASQWFFVYFLNTLFGNDITVFFQGSNAPTSIALFVKIEYFDFIKNLAIQGLLPIPIAFDVIIVKQPPIGYYYFGFFNISYKDVIDSKMSLTKYNELIYDNIRYSYNDDGKTIYLSESDYFRV